VNKPGPKLPPGRAVTLPGRGRTWVYDSGPPPCRDGEGRPALMLLHGWTSTAALNWFRCFSALTREYRVVALDHRGHGRGIRSRWPFRLEDCADDAAALIEHLDLGPVTAVGYSMGGPVAQLLWKRHRDLVDGLVLCATAARFATRSQLRGPVGTLSFGASVVLSSLPAEVRRQGLNFLLRQRITPDVAPWAVSEWQRADLSALIQGGLALGRFDSRPWIGEIDVPTSVVVTTLDATVSPRRQWLLAEGIPGAASFTVAGDHRVCADEPRLFVPVVLDACRAAQQGWADHPVPVRAGEDLAPRREAGSPVGRLRD
jgi:pimeloyl-ACP methyl ester carboxylesterase